MPLGESGRQLSNDTGFRCIHTLHIELVGSLSLSRLSDDFDDVVYLLTYGLASTSLRSLASLGRWVDLIFSYLMAKVEDIYIPYMSSSDNVVPP